MFQIGSTGLLAHGPLFKCADNLPKIFAQQDVADIFMLCVCMCGYSKITNKRIIRHKADKIVIRGVFTASLFICSFVVVFKQASL